VGAIFDILIYQPFSWILLMLYRVTSSYGMALILFQLVIKVITLPLSIKGKRGMMQQTLLQPRLKELEAQFKGDKQKYQAAMSELYQKEGVNPMSGCLWSLIPMPIFFMVFAIVRQPLTYLMGLKGPEGAAQIAKLVEAFNLESGADIFYQEMQLASLMFQNQDVAIRAVPELFNATFINFHFLGLDLSMRPEVAFHPLIIIPILSAASAYLMGWCTNKFNGTKVEGKGKTMQMLMPLMSLWFGFIMPAGMGVYWIATAAFRSFRNTT